MTIAHLRLLTICLIVVFCVACEPPAPRENQNLLVVSFDTVRADHLGCYGYPLDITPTADSLAERGILFERVYAPMGMTLPSHATMMTGVEPRVHGALENLYTVSRKMVTLAEYLGQRKYATGAFVGAAVLNKGTGIGQGFRTFAQPGAKYPAGTVEVENILRLSADKVNRAAVGWAKSLEPDQNFFMWVHYYDAHGPFNPPRETVRALREQGLVESVVDPRRSEFSQQNLKPTYIESLWANYAADVKTTDQELGRLLAQLESMGKLQNTWIVLTADHGEGLWEHSERGHGPTIFEEQVRVPLIIVDPQGGHKNLRVQEPVQLVDLMPTLLHAALDERIEGAAGIDLLAWIDAGSKPLERPIFIERPHYSDKGLDAPRGGNKNRYPYGVMAGVIIGADKYVIKPDGVGLLYDLEQDPREFHDLAAEHPERAQQMRAILEQHLADNPTAAPGVRPNVSAERRSALEGLGYAGE